MKHSAATRASTAVGLAFAFATAAGCAGGQGHPAAADCNNQMRLGKRVYTSSGYTDRDATRFGEADEAECHDLGGDAPGSVFPDDPKQVTTWSFAGYPTDKVLGVRFDEDSFAVYVADTLPRAESGRIFRELRRDPGAPTDREIALAKAPGTTGARQIGPPRAMGRTAITERGEPSLTIHRWTGFGTGSAPPPRRGRP